jgi:hypothetical protein
MDGVTDVKFCIEMGKLGGLGVINLGRADTLRRPRQCWRKSQRPTRKK